MLIYRSLNIGARTGIFIPVTRTTFELFERLKYRGGTVSTHMEYAEETAEDRDLSFKYSLNQYKNIKTRQYQQAEEEVTNKQNLKGKENLPDILVRRRAERARAEEQVPIEPVKLAVEREPADEQVSTASDKLAAVLAKKKADRATTPKGTETQLDYMRACLCRI
jgi:hypothetical protein